MRLTALLLLAGCSSPVAPIGTEPMVPRTEYIAWMAQVMTCMGQSPLDASGRVGAIEWQTTPRFLSSPDKIVWGTWDKPGTITLRKDVVADRNIVKHEMVHDRLRGDPKHKDPLWRCAA